MQRINQLSILRKGLLNSLPLFMAVIFFPAVVFANNIQVSQLSLSGQDTTSGYTQVRFNLSWENSWRYNLNSGINNWDAAWVFVKFRAGGTDPVFTGISSSGNVITVSSTADLRVGMPVTKLAGTGTITGGSVITVINSATTFTISGSAPGLSAATIHCGRIWEHARLRTTGHSPGPGLQADPGLLTPSASWHATSNPVVGLFIYRSAVGEGTINNNIQLRWHYADNGLSHLSMLEVQVFAVEMVYVPQGSFYAGSGGGGTAEFYSGNTSTPYLVNGEGAITVGSASSNLYYPSATLGGDQSGPIPAAFPKGYNAYYCMKHELSQQQYVDFLNTLTRSQQANRVSATTVGSFAGTTDAHTSPQNRNGVRVISDPGSTFPRVYGCDLNENGTASQNADGQWIAMNYLSWMDAAAYLDWAGLRPMTELEYEKASRGIQYPVAREFAWGDTLIAGSNYGLSQGGTTNEVVGNNYGSSVGNALYDSTSSSLSGPVRGGVFATAGSRRQQSGSSYWGIMDLSGGVAEQVVTLGNATGRTYTGSHGSGDINTTGNAFNTAFWPGISGSEVTAATGSGFRGGAWSDNRNVLRTSNRSAVTTANTSRTSSSGIRGVRTAACSHQVAMPDAISITEGLTSRVPNHVITARTSLSGYSGDFIWSVSDDWKILNGQANDTLKILVGNGITRVRVAATNSCGSGPEQSLRLVSNLLATGGDSVYSYIADGTNGEAGKKYIVHTFTTVGSHTFQPLVSLTAVDYLIVAGGGGGGLKTGNQEGPGGGGAGGLLTSFDPPAGGTGPISLNASPYPITVGSGGVAQTNGGNSTFFNLTAIGGGFGGTAGSGSPTGGSGGSGGGSSGAGGEKPGGSGTVGPPRQGYNGGNGLWVIGTSGGGGGAGSAGGTNSVGGDGLVFNITGTATTYSVGGGGGLNGVSGVASPSIGSGGAGVWTGNSSTAAVFGKNGAVIIRYKIENN
jgi:formylglycine-generating enzyme required for sulfatase activity